MLVDCYVVFRCVTRRYRALDGSVARRVDYDPAFVAEDRDAACRFRDALTEETGEPARLGRSKLWKEG